MGHESPTQTDGPDSVTNIQVIPIYGEMKFEPPQYTVVQIDGFWYISCEFSTFGPYPSCSAAAEGLRLLKNLIGD
jgi:hypothetical protein